MTDDGESALYEHLQRNADGALHKAEEGNLLSAYEEFLVGLRVAQMALSTPPEDLTPDRVELSSRLAWAEAELSRGNSLRLPDDLEHTQELAGSLALREWGDDE